MSGSQAEGLGYSDCMGPRLRQFVEEQLLSDLNRYLRSGLRLSPEDVRFDWSDSCVEGHRTDWMDGEIENFSSVAVVDHADRFIAVGWMEFIETEDDLKVFWWFLEGRGTYDMESKTSNQVPRHIWDDLSEEVRLAWRDYAPRERRLP